MRLKAIFCNVFTREASLCIARSPHVIDAEFTELGEHIHSATLGAGLQARIDAADASGKGYEAILLGYGLCGNAAVGLQAGKTRLVIPRAHDCCAILLGSKDTFRERFQDNPSQAFSSAGYLERGDYYLRVEDGESRLHYGDGYAALVEQYGEDNARYVWDAMHPERPGSNKAVFIDLPETAPLGYAEQFRRKAESEGKEYVRIQGDMRILRNLLSGEWNSEDFLVVEPGRKIAGVYDWSEIVRSVPA